MKNVQYLGQVFTPSHIVRQMIALCQNHNTVLEPSCGDGAFFEQLFDFFPHVTGIEFDTKVCPLNALNMDFFDYPITQKFDTIIGNPPYVKYKNINTTTKEKLLPSIKSGIFDERANLYFFFIEKCARHLNDKGEMIFIVPRDFLKASSAVNLNRILKQEGTITHLYDLGDENIFPGFSPNCVIFRWEKGNYTAKTQIKNEEFNFQEINGQLCFTKKHYPVAFSDLFFVKVGAVSGDDSVFVHDSGETEMVFSRTRKTKKTKTVIYNTATNYLLTYKEQLLKRKIRVFNEKNWFHWGRNYFESDKPRIYVNVKTRQNNPFFTHECKAYDGSLLAIFPKKDVSIENLEKMCDLLNKVDWSELGFVCDGRYLFSQRSLETCFLPKDFEIFLKTDD